jgi:hypothetical protein
MSGYDQNVDYEKLYIKYKSKYLQLKGSGLFTSIEDIIDLKEVNRKIFINSLAAHSHQFLHCCCPKGQCE